MKANEAEGADKRGRWHDECREEGDDVPDLSRRAIYSRFVSLPTRLSCCFCAFRLETHVVASQGEVTCVVVVTVTAVFVLDGVYRSKNALFNEVKGLSVLRRSEILFISVP